MREQGSTNVGIAKSYLEGCVLVGTAYHTATCKSSHAAAAIYPCCLVVAACVRVAIGACANHGAGCSERGIEEDNC